MCIRIKGAPVTPFLNDILLVIQDRGLTIVSGGLFTLFVLYLLSANIKGNFKFGVRIPFLFTMHPMKLFFLLFSIKIKYSLFFSGKMKHL